MALTKAQWTLLERISRDEAIYYDRNREIRGAKLAALNRAIRVLLTNDLVTHGGAFFTYRLTDAGRTTLTSTPAQAGKE